VLLAFAFALLLHLDAFITPEAAPFLFTLMYRAITINCVLACFNLIPILPLDGGRVVAAALPTAWRTRWMKAERASFLLLLLLLLVPSYLGFDAINGILFAPTFGLVETLMYLSGNSE
ncbi:MAG: site-2 protease family protein, partial [Rickettsiales bacterium]|nr:site-2 protease family protein [Rickettsiales bacterium]